MATVAEEPNGATNGLHEQLKVANGNHEQAPAENDDEGSDSEPENADGTGELKPKKKKKKGKKKKKTGAAAVTAVQTDPPRVGITKFFPSGQYPEGQICEYTGE
jgi:methionyl aminopeptidase